MRVDATVLRTLEVRKKYSGMHQIEKRQNIQNREKAGARGTGEIIDKVVENAMTGLTGQKPRPNSTATRRQMRLGSNRLARGGPCGRHGNKKREKLNHTMPRKHRERGCSPWMHGGGGGGGGGGGWVFVWWGFGFWVGGFLLHFTPVGLPPVSSPPKPHVLPPDLLSTKVAALMEAHSPSVFLGL